MPLYEYRCRNCEQSFELLVNASHFFALLVVELAFRVCRFVHRFFAGVDLGADFQRGYPCC